MTYHAVSHPESETEAAAGLTLAKTAVLVAFAAFVWFCAALYIRYSGPLGAFVGVKGLTLFALTIPGTLPINWIARKISGLPPTRMVTVIAVTSATATMLDGIAMSQVPALYGPDPLIMGAGAVWLLWAIGVALALALITSSLSQAASSK